MWTIILSGISILVSIIALIISIIKYNQSKRYNAFNALLDIEFQLNSRKLELDTLLKDEEKAYLNGNEDLAKILKKYSESGKENFYNTLDRLAFGILNNYLSESELEKEYRNYILETIKTSPENFNEGSPFRNIKKLNDKWQN